MQTKSRISPTPLTLCLLHLEYHHLMAECLDHALEFVCRNPHLTPTELYEAYQTGAEQLLLDRWHKTQIL